MIDVFSTECLTLREVAAAMARCTRGRKVSVVTLLRYIKRGRNGVKLEAVKVGLGWCTTLEALNQFYLASSEARIAEPVPIKIAPPAPVRPVPLAAQRSNERAEQLGL